VNGEEAVVIAQGIDKNRSDAALLEVRICGCIFIESFSDNLSSFNPLHRHSAPPPPLLPIQFQFHLV